MTSSATLGTVDTTAMNSPDCLQRTPGTTLIWHYYPIGDGAHVVVDLK